MISPWVSENHWFIPACPNRQPGESTVNRRAIISSAANVATMASGARDEDDETLVDRP